MNNKKIFTDAMNFRHACKIFDEKKKINENDLRYILNAGINSPSSFGMEGWKFLVITNQKLKEELKPYCWNQPQITTCSHLIVILAAINRLRSDSGVPIKRFKRRKGSKDMVEKYLIKYKDYIKNVIGEDDESIFQWSARQTYIAAANMMTAAATIHIDSCPIEGFERDKVEEILKLNTKEFRVSLLLPFGYRINIQPKRLRLSFYEVVDFISPINET